MLEISDLEIRGIILCSENKAADLRLCFRICKLGFLMTKLNFILIGDHQNVCQTDPNLQNLTANRSDLVIIIG